MNIILTNQLAEFWSRDGDVTRGDSENVTSDDRKEKIKLSNQLFYDSIIYGKYI